MYAVIDGLEFVALIGAMIYAIVSSQWYIGVPCAIFWCVYPVMNEMIYNCFALIFGSHQRFQPKFRSRFVYSDNYNLSFCGLENLHPFDSQKYKHVIEKLLEYGIVTQNSLEKSQKISRSLLLEKVSMCYLLKLCYSILLSKYIEMPFCLMPNFLLRWRVLNPMMLATEGTLIACELAEQMRWSVNLSGGYHHASTSSGGGFCVYPDITLAVHYIRTRLEKRKIMIIDLDAHQGNGYQRDLIDDDDTFIVDCYNHNIYPGDKQAKKAIKLDMSVTSFTSDFDYLTSLKRIGQAVKNFRPEFIIYNAGTDTLEGDPLGNLSLTKQCIISRDEYITNLGLVNKVPVVMLLSGGYQKTNAGVIADSIKNLQQKFGYQLDK